MLKFLFVSTLSLTGCVSVAPETEVRDALDSFHAAQKSGDIDALLAKYSEDFTNSQGATKAVIGPFLQTMIAQGLFEGVTPALENLKITVNGDSAVATPVEYQTPLGKAGWTYEFKKEADGVWRVTSAEQLF